MTDAPLPNEGLIGALRVQAATCEAMGSPFSGALLHAAAEDVARGGRTSTLMSRWSETSARAALTDAVPLRLLGALHDLALSGEDARLASAYPSTTRAGDPSVAWQAALDAMEGHKDRLAAFLDHEPQTNEVRRSACLLPGFLTIAAETGLPIRAFELGASAGLNLLWDQHHYGLGSVGSWGSPDARVHISTEWRGGPPPLDAPVRVIGRSACDRKPVDVSDAADRRRLRAYVWADQLDRLERLDAAIALALAAQTKVAARDAVEWVDQIALQNGAVTVLYHSVFWQYLPPYRREALAERIRALGESASESRPFAWLRMEPRPDNLGVMELSLTMWPTGGDRRLAEVHPHGAWIAWAEPDGQPDPT